MRTRRLLLTFLVTLGPACSDDKDPMGSTNPSTQTAPSSDPGTGDESATDAVTTGDGGETSETSPTTANPTTANPTTANPTTADPTTNDPTTNDPTNDPTVETTTTADPTNDPTQTTQTTNDPTGDPDEAATQLCVDTINMYRAGIGLPPYARWTDAESCSDGEAQSDGQTNTPHGAFGTCGEFAQNECPGWPGPPEAMIEGCLAQMWAEGPGDDFSMHGHYINMSSQSYTEVACGYAEVNGQIWAVQNFR